MRYAKVSCFGKSVWVIAVLLCGLAAVGFYQVAEKGSQADISVDEIVFYKGKNMYNKLTDKEKEVIIHKGTEPAFSGKYDDH